MRVGSVDSVDSIKVHKSLTIPNKTAGKIKEFINGRRHLVDNSELVLTVKATYFTREYVVRFVSGEAQVADRYKLASRVSGFLEAVFFTDLFSGPTGATSCHLTAYINKYIKSFSQGQEMQPVMEQEAKKA